MSKVITVFGATGNQGGSVIKAILADSKLASEYKIRGITRDTSKPAAQELAKKGVELVSVSGSHEYLGAALISNQADLNSLPSVASAIKGSHSVFLVTNYWETGKSEVELAQGHNVADAAKEAGVHQLIFSSLLDVSKETNGRLTHVPHFDGKAHIEEYIRNTGMMCAFMQPGYFMSNWTQILRRGDDGSFSVALPIGTQSQFPLVDAAADLGKFVMPALRDPERWNGKHLLASPEYLSLERIMSDFTEVTGHKVNFHKVTNEQYKSFLPEFMADEYLENHLFLEDPGYYAGASLKETLDAVPEKLTTWKEFVAKTQAFH